MSLWHYHQDGQARGPLEVSLLVELIANGRLPRDVLVWGVNGTQWVSAQDVHEIRRLIPPGHPNERYAGASPQPLMAGHTTAPSIIGPGTRARSRTRAHHIKLGDIPPIMKENYRVSVGPEFEAPVDVVSSENYPGRRWFARILDIWLFAATIGGATLLVFRPEFTAQDNDLMVGMVLLGMWVPFEGISVALFGTTPGKILLNIRIRSMSGQKPGPWAAFRRALHVWAAGMGFGMPLVSLVTMGIGHSKLVKNGATSWDEGRFVVVHGKVGIGRVMSILALSVVLLALLAAGSA